MKQKTLIIELHYLPSVQYFVYFNYFKNIFIDPADNYIKQSYRNRCRINGANKPEDLIIPIKKIPSPKKTIQMEIDYQQKWLNKHLRAIQSAYGKAPFYEYYADDFLSIFNKKENSLFSLNKNLLTKCLEILELDVTINFKGSIENLDENDLYDGRNEINPKKSNFSGSIFLPQKYFQVFGNNFVQNLSVIDLIFCEGPQARHFIQKSCQQF